MAGGLVGQASHLRRCGVVLGQQFAGIGNPGLHQHACRVNERIALEILVYLGWCAIPDLSVGAGVSQEANAPQVQEGRAPSAAHVFDGLQRHVVRGRDIRPLGAEITQMRAIRPGCVHPVARSADADSKAVVLAAEQHRHPESLVHGVLRGVQRAKGGRVVARGIAE
jgi:hypothetical protein